MEKIRDVDQHLLCIVDEIQGTLEYAGRKLQIRITLPVGGEVAFICEKTYTVIRRESCRLFRVNSVHLTPSG